MNRSKIGIVIISMTLLFPSLVLAQQAEKVQQEERQIEQEKALRERIEQEPAAPVIEEQPVVSQPLPSKDQKAFVKKITVTGVTLLSQMEIADIVAPFENKEISLADMQKVVDLITDAYRSKGYVTSRGYLPPQKIEGGELQIKAIEGTTGDVEVKGNRFFRSALIRKAIILERGEPFNYDDLRVSLSKLNEHPDRQVKAVLVPGKDPGSTDIVLQVTDRLPLHARLDWDNYGSRYVRKDRYSTTLSHNNLLGFDDIFSLQYQLADAEDYRLLAARYLAPVNPRTKVGVYATHSKLALGQEYRALQSRGKSRMYGIFGMYEMLSRNDLTVTFNTGFDYLDSFNFQAGVEQSRDRLRWAKLGFDIDYSNPWGGRTIFSPESDFGFSGIMGGLKAKDSRASRTGAGGKFLKHSANLLHLQKAPWSTAVLWKNQLQLSPYVLAASQQMQIGGISNVRGYPSGEYVGDQGFTSTLEWIIPPYCCPKDLKVPFSKATFYNAFKTALFYDLGWVRLKNPQAGERKRGTLRSVGFGFRFTLPEDFSLRVDLAWPLAKTPSDGDHFHPWLSASKQF
ncbi:MAG TPA: ShlB/FhaC/HecB family hemolysin secretion/activation protein [Candidatus Omnitrophota bacterium]|nr:ShlB/FhaC/HecB family hemolysin secretion/activation protein [Candidatus Omnitrophota bacterium]HRZ14434.1 ShlB/FhaC/HecB family hemolysin secretion/activation protein [Candidatus Omnitrophota bacterium]